MRIDRPDDGAFRGGGLQQHLRPRGLIRGSTKAFMNFKSLLLKFHDQLSILDRGDSAAGLKADRQ
jgi:hypothetical protein